MTVIVTVRIPEASLEAVQEVDRTHPHLRQRIREAAKRHGSLSHRRAYRENEILDIDEWESEAGLERFLAEAGDAIGELARLRGAGEPVHTVWRPYPG